MTCDHYPLIKSSLNVVVGKHGLGLSLHHAVPVEVCPSSGFTWTDQSQGEFYPGRPRHSPHTAIIPRVGVHRVSNRGSILHIFNIITINTQIFSVTTHQVSKNTQSFYLHANNEEDGIIRYPKFLNYYH